MHIIDPEDPRLLYIHAQRLDSRELDKLLGICEFALMDGHIDSEEGRAVLDWMNQNKRAATVWPANIIYSRLNDIFADGNMNSEEERDLLSLIMSIIRPSPGEPQAATSLPLCQPSPSVSFQDKTFCFTGVFSYGKRSDCVSAIQARGGISLDGITKKLNYLVIGDIGSEAWKHSSFGNKIIKAVEYRDSGLPLNIISEEHWIRQL
jgi:NAD-dependent DNA ligase